jgi:hypothetical protein
VFEVQVLVSEFAAIFASVMDCDCGNVGRDEAEPLSGFMAALSGSQFKAPGSAGGYLLRVQRYRCYPTEPGKALHPLVV